MPCRTALCRELASCIHSSRSMWCLCANKQVNLSMADCSEERAQVMYGACMEAESFRYSQTLGARPLSGTDICIRAHGQGNKDVNGPPYCFVPAGGARPLRLLVSQRQRVQPVLLCITRIEPAGSRSNQ